MSHGLNVGEVDTNLSGPIDSWKVSTLDTCVIVVSKFRYAWLEERVTEHYVLCLCLVSEDNAVPKKLNLF